MPEWPAEQIPELYPVGTADKLRKEIQAIKDAIAQIDADNPFLSLTEKRKLAEKWAKKNRYSYGEDDKGAYIFVASEVAPELDCYVEVP